MDARTAVVDDVFSGVGSGQLDGRSIEQNHELDVIVLGEDSGAQSGRRSDRDVQDSGAITLERWQQRSVADRLLERLAGLIEPMP